MIDTLLLLRHVLVIMPASSLGIPDGWRFGLHTLHSFIRAYW